MATSPTLSAPSASDSMYPREYSTFQDAVKKARNGKLELASEQQFVIQIESLVEWMVFSESDEFPEDVQFELRAVPFPAIIIFGAPSQTHEFLNALFTTKPFPSGLRFYGRPYWALTNGMKAPDIAFLDGNPPLPDSDIRTSWASVIFEVADLQGTSSLRTACNRWITESPPQCLLTVVGVDIQRDTGGDIAHVDVITWRLVHLQEDLNDDYWVLKSHNPKTQWRVYVEENIQRMYSTDNPPLRKPFVLSYRDLLHNTTEDGIAFTITTEEFKKYLHWGEKLRQANLEIGLDIKCGRALGNKSISRADEEFVIDRIRSSRRMRQTEEKESSSPHT